MQRTYQMTAIAMITVQLQPWEFDIVSSALALYAKEGDDMGDLERDEVSALRDRLEAQLEEPK